MSFISCVLILLIFCPFTAILCCYIPHSNKTQFKRKNEEKEKKSYYGSCTTMQQVMAYTPLSIHFYLQVFIVKSHGSVLRFLVSTM